MSDVVLLNSNFANLALVGLNESQQLSGFSYSPDNRKDAGHLENYKIYLSNDGKEWGNPLCTGRFGNIINETLVICTIIIVCKK